MTFAATAKFLKRSKDFVRKWVNRYKDTNTVDDLPNRGLKRSTTVREDKVVVELFKRKDSLTLRRGQELLRREGVNMSIMTIRQRLLENNLAWRSTKIKPLLSEAHVRKRLEWARANIDRDWSDVIFTDESSFWAWLPRKKSWAMRGSAKVQRSVKHPVKVHV